MSEAKNKDLDCSEENIFDVCQREKELEVPEDNYSLQILQSLRRIIRAVDLYSRRLKREYNITTPQLICLKVISENCPITASEISRLIYLSASTVTGIVDRLEKQEYVLRQRQVNDRRVVHISITEKGKELIKVAPSPLQDKLAQALKTLPILERTNIALSLFRIVELMEAKEVSAAPILEM